MSKTQRLVLILISSPTWALGALFAVQTPAWQAPDEPAHYNYVRYLAENGAFPVLHMGDYPHVPGADQGLQASRRTCPSPRSVTSRINRRFTMRWPRRSTH